MISHRRFATIAAVFLLVVSACSTGEDYSLPAGGNAYTTFTGSNPGAVSFAAIQEQILVPKCSSCHSGSGPEGGFSVASYQSVSQFVTAGSASSSQLYTQISSLAMPPGGTGLPTAEIQQIGEWIQAGAQNN